MDYEYCLNCKKNAEVVMDYSTGDTVCVECGLVLEACYVDERSEWRCFADDSGDGADPNRVGWSANPLLGDAPLDTVISKTKGGATVTSGGTTARLKRWAPNLNPSNNINLTRGFEGIANMCDLLGLVATIKNRACEIFKKVEDKKASCRFKNRDALLAASLLLACRQEGKNRTLKEICCVSNGVSLREIGRAEKYIAKQVPDLEVGVAGLSSGSLMVSRFGSYLGLKHEAVKAAREAIGNSQELDIRRNPVSIAAAVMYMVTQVSADKKSLKDVSTATGVAQGTIRDSYKDLHPHISKILPTWFTQQTLKV